MPVYKRPRNDKARFALLKTAYENALADAAKGDTILSQQTLNQIVNIIDPMETVLEQLTATSAQRAREVIEKTDVNSKLELYVRDLWEGIRRRINREDLPPSVLKYYELPLSGITPTITGPAQLLSIAESIVKGDSLAVDNGYAPMANPSKEEIATVLEEARRENQDVSNADSMVDSLEAQLAQFRLEADRMIEDIVAELRFKLRREDEASQRRIMRRYGLTFKSETPEESAAE